MQALLLGQSVAGVATSVLSFATIWRTGSGSTQAKPTAEDVKSAAIQYFLACAIIEILGIIAYFLLPQIAFVQHHTVGEGQPNLKTLNQKLFVAALSDAIGNTQLECSPVCCNTGHYKWTLEMLDHRSSLITNGASNIHESAQLHDNFLFSINSLFKMGRWL